MKLLRSISNTLTQQDGSKNVNKVTRGKFLIEKQETGEETLFLGNIQRGVGLSFGRVGVGAEAHSDVDVQTAATKEAHRQFAGSDALELDGDGHQREELVADRAGLEVLLAALDAVERAAHGQRRRVGQDQRQRPQFAHFGRTREAEIDARQVAQVLASKVDHGAVPHLWLVAHDGVVDQTELARLRPERWRHRVTADPFVDVLHHLLHRFVVQVQPEVVAAAKTRPVGQVEQEKRYLKLKSS